MRVDFWQKTGNPQMQLIETLVRSIDARLPDAATLAEAAAILRRGGLVAFPTETVYGLGANARDANAVTTLFAAKGRPSANPLIVHVSDIAMARDLTKYWSDLADRLVQRFWPGPLTIVLPRNEKVPDIVTAGGPTVGLRMPAHPVALGLIRAAGLPVAAPSANRSGEISPTQAVHVLRSLGGRIGMILDAGPTTVGLESTVIDLTSAPPRILRPGHITRAELEALIGPVEIAIETTEKVQRSPGNIGRHYAPRTRAELIPQDLLETRINELTGEGCRVGCLVCGAPSKVHSCEMLVELSCDPVDYAAGMYAALHDLDAAGLDRILIVAPPQSEDWLAVYDRLRRAVSE